MADSKIKTGNSGKVKSKLSFFRDDRFRLSAGSFILLLSLFLTLSFVSYFFTWKTDQSFEWEKILSSPEIRVENWAGKTGAWLSSLFINKWFGISSFTIPFILMLAGFRILRVKMSPVGRTIRITITGAILLSVSLGYLFGDGGGFLGSGPGGAHGYYLAEWLNAILGKTGTALLILLLIFTFLLFSIRGASDYIKDLFTRRTQTFDPPPANEAVTTGAVPDTEPEDTSSGKTENEPFEIDDGDEAGKSEIEGSVYEEDDVPEKDGVKLHVREKKADEGSLPDDMINKSIPEDYDPTLDLPSYKFPLINLLEHHKTDESSVSKEELINNKNRIVETLGNYKINIDKITATIGPTVTLYEIVPAPGIRISKIKNLEDDIALSLSALGIRIIAPIPGRGTIGIEVPNQNPEIVSMRSVISSVKFQDAKYELPVVLGKTISNDTFVVDLTRMPHLLIAGATGQGKSVGLNAILTSLLYKKHPAQLKLVLIDPKKVELTVYSKIERHFLAKLPDTDEAIITDTQKVINTLQSLTIEMDERYNLLKEAHVRNIKEYNTKFIARRLNPQKGHKYLPYIVVIIDEFADLIMTAGREIETPLTRLAQLARAIGIHLVIATQRPTTNIITGVIKANFPSRIAFRVTSMMDSRTILDTPGANQLIGRGDMLITAGSEMIRLQCAFIDTPEIDRVTEYIGSQKGYPSAHLLPEYVGDNETETAEVDLRKRDDIFDEAARLVVQHQQGSTSLIQRKFSIGYNRAGRIIDQLEAAGVVGPFEGSKARQVLIRDEYTLEQLLNELDS
ncbi:MAG: DNA translocase FtsK [Marinilabiliales bacterium]|nr:MAG: DNA translocase FtsK [Marinilabiliales bacterium]